MSEPGGPRGTVTDARSVRVQVRLLGGGFATAALLAIVACADRAPSTEVPTLALGAPLARSADGFTFISSIRVLPDDRVQLVDPREARIVVFTPALTDARPTSRRGPGPNEWLTATPLFAMRGDTSLQPDPVSRRWRIWRDTAIIRTLPPDAPLGVWAGFLPKGADADGHVLITVREDPRVEHSRTGPTADRFAAVRVALQTAQVDTVTTLADAPATIELVSTGASNPPARVLSRGAFATGEDAVMFPDGAVAVARLNPYRVDWFWPRTRDSLTGAPFGIAGTPIDERERTAYLARHQSTVASLERAEPEMRRVLMRRFTEFPAEIPPFGANALLAGGDGRLYVRRSETARDTLPQYDIIDRNARLVGRLVLDQVDMRLVAATSAHWYVTRRDAMDVEYLEKHPNSLLP